MAEQEENADSVVGGDRLVAEQEENAGSIVGEKTLEEIWLKSTARRSLILEPGSPSPLAGVDGVPVDENEVRRGDFPEDFIFGTATSAYQVEGHAKKGKRGLSIWDTFCDLPGKITDGRNGDKSVHQYHKYKEDVNLMADIGFNAYRFSISWSRIMPDGFGAVNDKGVAYYNDLLDKLLKKNMQPFVTLYHWDLPQGLHDQNPSGGWINPRVVAHFAHYAEFCFATFGSKVKHWITLNEPLVFAVLGYGTGEHAPGRCSDKSKSPVGDSAVEPYLVAHHALLAHAAAVDIYRKKFQEQQGGLIGMSCNGEWCEPLTDMPEDQEAAQRRLEFQLGWFLDPIFLGDYPACMRLSVQDRLPTFTPEEISSLRASLDFIGLNHYTSRYVKCAEAPRVTTPVNYYTDQGTSVFMERNGVPIGERGASDWLYVVPWGLEKLLCWLAERYKRVPIFVTENGVDERDDKRAAIADRLRDTKRITYHQSYMAALSRAMRKDEVDVRGYFVWSLLDNFEWAQGYTKRFGIFFVDHEDHDLKRQPKTSALWLTSFFLSTSSDDNALKAAKWLRRHSNSSNPSPTSSGSASPSGSRPGSRVASPGGTSHRRKSSLVHPPAHH